MVVEPVVKKLYLYVVQFWYISITIVQDLILLSTAVYTLSLFLQTQK